MRALILSAGLGTRLRPLTHLRAKAAIPVNGESLIRRIVRRMSDRGFTDLIVNISHLPATITGLVGDGSDLGVRLRYSWEQPVLGSAGGPRHALPLLVEGDDDPRARFLLVNGDTLTDVDLHALVDAHEHAGDATVTMALIENPQPEKYGGVLVEGDRVAGFTRAGEVSRNYHFIGLQVAEARAFSSLTDGQAAESVNKVYRALLAKDARAICAYISKASFQDIGTPADYLRTSLELAALEGDKLASGANVRMDPSAALIETAVWDDVTIGAGARLERTIVCDGAHVPAGGSYRQCVLLPVEGRTAGPGEYIEHGLLVSPL